MDWFQKGPQPSDEHERNRYEARLDKHGDFTLQTFLRGSAPGVKDGPFLSQFLLVGNEACNGSYGIDKGRIQYGIQIINQRVCVHKVGVDFMTDWCSWLDVQKGADVREAEDYESNRRFITTPRDLATYVHHDALYQAYLNACLIMLGLEIPFDKGFPEGKGHPTRDAFATFGGPHILSLLTEVATRALKAVRRQKFNQHCRARPEVIGGLLTLYENGHGGKLGKKGEKAIRKLYALLPSTLLEYIHEHNDLQKGKARKLTCTGSPPFPIKQDQNGQDQNLLLPMAFPEGSPMHPSYGAGHATVAGDGRRALLLGLL